MSSSISTACRAPGLALRKGTLSTLWRICILEIILLRRADTMFGAGESTPWPFKGIYQRVCQHISVWVWWTKCPSWWQDKSVHQSSITWNTRGRYVYVFNMYQVAAYAKQYIFEVCRGKPGETILQILGWRSIWKSHIQTTFICASRCSSTGIRL